MAFLRNPRLVALARVLFVVALVISVIMALIPVPPQLPIDKFGDKFEHMLAFGTLAGLAALAFPGSTPWQRIERLSFLGALIEVFQAIPALHRDCDFRDWIADTLAVVAITLICTVILPPQREGAKEKL
jgi:VanZ family protein